MKKFIITALIALVMGGFSFTANAQGDDLKVKTSNTQLQEQPKIGKQDNKKSSELNQYEKTLKSYETQVTKCFRKYNELAEMLTKTKDITEKNSSQQQKVEKLRRELDSYINDRYNGAKVKRAEVEKVERQLNSDQQTRFKTANSTLEDVIDKFEKL